MDSGRSTPVAMTRPSSRPSSISSARRQDTTSSTREQEQRSVNQAQIPPPPPLHHPPTRNFERTAQSTFERAGMQSVAPTCLLPSIVNIWFGNFEAVRSTIATAFGLGWAVYTRAFRLDMQTWTSSAKVLQPSLNKDLLSDFCMEGLRDDRVTNKPQPWLHAPLTVETPKSCSFRDSRQDAPSPIEIETPKLPPASCNSTGKDPAYTTHALLRKHFNYLLPWVSNQPETPCEDDNTSTSGTDTTSETRMADEFRRMSTQHFTDLSTAIYRDVRRREQESSPESPQPPRWEPCMRNRQNESRMVLCRTINEQYYGLVMAVVLEQARRLAEIRIRLFRRGFISKG